ncbi:hypothetical protein Krac_11834 [Ktedonobacter racemifer DSM 44963]|uniref:Uncharacterized protein n=1 Tax=Ktedonobacter racemifer DSM 44963 TaxID=485913 RepID=D6TDU1_KTERA|nr:hypothetical protein Krac_11834 [Ktedonobacter racemifer DSM 44963]
MMRPGNRRLPGRIILFHIPYGGLESEVGAVFIPLSYEAVAHL